MVINKPPPNSIEAPKESSDAVKIAKPPSMPIGNATQVIVAGENLDNDFTIGTSACSQ